MSSFSVSNTLMFSITKEMDFLTLRIVWVFTLCVLSSYLSTAAPAITAETKAIEYLQKYGYMEKTNPNSSSGMIMDEAGLSHSIKDFQKFTGLAETGELDKPTLDMMSLPRCGVKDKVEHSGSSRRSKRYAVLGSRYKPRTTALLYRITKYPSSIKDRAEVDKEIARAFKVWSDVTSLKFEVASVRNNFFNQTHIEIRFEKGEHGEGEDNSFDGKGGTLAHAYSPEHGSDVCFDDEEQWTIRDFSGENLFQVAVHEFGHSLGLGHSSIKSAVMFPTYLGYKPHFTLDEDDILGIQELYGKPKNEDVAPKPESEPREDHDEIGSPDLCQNFSIDAATVTEDEQTYFFKGNYYWKIEDETGISEGYPRKIYEDWPGLPGDLDAALTSTNGKTYFFKKHQYWRFHNKKADRGYPHNISYGLRGIPDDIDTVFEWSGRIFFFKGDKYWAYVGSRVPPVSFLYPAHIKEWKNVPNSLDASFQWTNGHTYMFKGDEYYRMKDTSVDNAFPPYPRSSSAWWLNCEKAPDICKDPAIDAATTTKDGQTNEKFYVFKGNFYWEIGKTGVSNGYPRKISKDWSGLPGDLDAALTLKNGGTFFFKKNQYWRFHNKMMDSGYPQNISTGFPGIPNDIDSAFFWLVNEKIYFFKGDKYWRFDNESNPDISSRYPQPISNWEGLPNDIDAALWWQNNAYFFKGSQYYKLNDKTPSVAIPEPPNPSYPRPTYFWIFDCEGFKKTLYG